MSSTDEVNRLQITLQELSDATNGFSNENLLAMGGFGKVYKGVSVKHGNIAIKMLDPRLGQGDHEFKTEIALLSVYKHENIVSLLGFCDEDGKKLLVYKFESKGSLDKHLKSVDLTWIQRLQICLDAARGLQYLHDGVEPHRRILHRDIKSSNILLDENWKARISDFGLSRMGPANVEHTFLVSNPCGTFAYIDPEYQTKGYLTQKSDVYSFGVVLFEVLCGRLACIMKYEDERWFLTTLITIHWKNNSLDKIINFDLRRQINRASLNTFSNIAYQCLKSGNERPTMEEVVKQLQKALENQQAPSDMHDGDHFTAHFRGQLGQETVSCDYKDDSLKDFSIPGYILGESKVKNPLHIPPVIVFVNSKSGGQLGRQLLVSYRTLLNTNQVFDLNEDAPYKVLHQLYFNIEKFKHDGDSLALEIQRKLRIIVAGSDGTAGGILGVISDMQLTQPPPVATLPLGTGNNLPFAFGWGKKNPGTDLESVKMLLYQVNYAKEMKVDSWHVLMQMKVPTREEGVCDPIPPLDLPHSLHAVHHVDQSDALVKEGYRTVHGGFWNYFSMGMDAQVSYTEIKSNPENFKNQSAYAKLTRSPFWASLSQPSSWNIAKLAKVLIMRKPGLWEQLTIPSNIQSIICLNLPSFSGGLNPWGMPSKRRLSKREWTLPYVDDGFLEIVGFRNPWHGAVLYGPAGNGIRLAQVRGIRFEFRKGATDYTFMTMDGEPWKQPLPKDDDTVTIEISCFGQVNMLAIGNCPSKSVHDPSTPHTPNYNEYDSDEEEVVADASEEQREFGAIPPSFFSNMASSSSFSVDAPPPY